MDDPPEGPRWIKGTLSLSVYVLEDDEEKSWEDLSGIEHRDRSEKRQLIVPTGLDSTIKKVTMQLDQNYLSEVERLLGQYLSEDEFWKFIQKDQEKRRTSVKNYFVKKITSYVLKYGYVWGVLEKETKILHGVMILLAPNSNFDISYRKLLKKSSDASSKLEPQVLNRYYKITKQTKKINKRIMHKKPHLRVLQPSPALYDPSISRLFLKLVIKAGNEDNIPIYHEVFSTKAVQFFSNFGFECLGKYQVDTEEKGDETFTFWVMVKYPKGGEIENGLSLVSDPVQRKALIKTIPETLTIHDFSEKEIGTILGPTEDRLAQSLRDGNIFANCISTYPIEIESGMKQGEPNADRYRITIYPKALLVSVADGCGWGNKARSAALTASNTFIEYMISMKHDFLNTGLIAKYILRAFRAAHESIISDGKSDDDLLSVGTTTMLGGVLMELAQKTEDTHVFVFANLGDCKAFHYSHSTGHFSDLTPDDKRTDPKDPGGRIGPYVDERDPDLRNLSLHQILCKEKDIIVIVTDGAHDNFDPFHLGKAPEEVGIEVEKPNDWSTIKNKEEALRKRRKWSENFLSSLVGKNASPKDITDKIISHCLKITQPGRDFMENPKTSNQRLPKDYSKYPGKMDHTTCVCFRVG